MTTAELIENLKQFPSDTRVIVSGYEDGYNDISDVKKVTIKLNVHKEEYYGAHAEHKGAGTIPAILLWGENKFSKE